MNVFDFDHVYSVGDVQGTGQLPLGLPMTAYPDPYQALTAAQPNTLILVAPGTYQSTSSDSNRIRYAGKVAVRGLGEVPSDVLLTRSLRNDTQFSPGAEVILENLHVQGLADSSGDNLFVSLQDTASAVFNRVLLELRSTRTDSGILLELSSGDGQDGPILFKNSTLRILNAGVVFNSYSSAGMKAARYSWEKTEVPSTGITLLGASILGDWAQADYVTAPTAGYGHLSGSFVIDLAWRSVSGTVRDVRGAGEPRVVVFQWSDPARFTLASLNDGVWSAGVASGVEFGVYYLSRDTRCPPVIHGPYTAE